MSESDSEDEHREDVTDTDSNIFVSNQSLV